MNSRNQNKFLIISALLLIASLIMLLIPEHARRTVRIFEQKGSGRANKVFVAEIIDGDTFKSADGHAFRLIGVDTPEENMPFFEEAADFARFLMAGKQITLEFDMDDLDKYGRSLVYAYDDSVLVNEEIIKNGLGIVYLFEPNLRHAAEFINGQKTARESRLGIWSLREPPAEDYYVHIKGSFRFHRPLCVALGKSNPDNREIYYSEDELFDKGYSPCRNCRP